MTDVDGQSLWRSVYTSGEGWSKPEPFAGHLSARGAALAAVDGTLHCAHKGQGEPGVEAPVMWTSFTPASVQPFVKALEAAAKPLPEKASEAEAAEREKKIQAASEALATTRKWSPDTETGVSSKLPPALVNDGGTLRLIHQVYRTNYPYYELKEVFLGSKDGAAVWSAPPNGLKYSASWPAAAAFQGTTHLVCQDR
ncbi:hypothetical protein, partial [Streptomyces sp. NPDC056405]|uniref:hypothetical protein n=1 Tax=Streptomyces sp. NPDC056405 TaxID=3345811 RepID=UPI0035D648CF